MAENQLKIEGDFLATGEGEIIPLPSQKWMKSQESLCKTFEKEIADLNGELERFNKIEEPTPEEKAARDFTERQVYDKSLSRIQRLDALSRARRATDWVGDRAIHLVFTLKKYAWNEEQAAKAAATNYADPMNPIVDGDTMNKELLVSSLIGVHADPELTIEQQTLLRGASKELADCIDDEKRPSRSKIESFPPHIGKMVSAELRARVEPSEDTLLFLALSSQTS